MKTSTYCPFILATTLLVGGVEGFQASRHALASSPLRSSNIPLASSKEDDKFPLSPETSFGADAVPENQRPVNEFLDVTSQPMFGWASLESGNKGLLTRLAVVYSVLFAAVCYPIAGATFTQEGTNSLSFF